MYGVEHTMILDKVFSYVINVLVKIKSTSDGDSEVFYIVGPVYSMVVYL